MLLMLIVIAISVILLIKELVERSRPKKVEKPRIRILVFEDEEFYLMKGGSDERE